MASLRKGAPAGLAAAIVVVVLSGAGVEVHSAPAAGVSREQLPDLDQEAPSEIGIREQVLAGGKRTYLLGFRSAVSNIGDGPLIVDGHRRDALTPVMTVDQLIDRDDERPRVIADVGRMQYTISPDHRHWHFLGFERYQLQRFELRHASSTDVLVQDQKTGFCLGDRYRVFPRVLRAAPQEAVYIGRCGLSDPDLLQVRAGISVGYGDDYAAYLEGQALPLDGLPDGRYVLVHRVDVNGRLHELSHTNNAASVLLDVHWRQRKPFIRVLAICPDTARCDDQDSATSAAKRREPVWPPLRFPDA